MKIKQGDLIMKSILSGVMLFVLGCYNKVVHKTPNVGTSAERQEASEKLLSFPLSTLSGKPTSLKELSGKAYLIVNTASKCGFTYQYEGLEALYKKFKDQGLVVVGFPSNDFGSQEPGTAEEIQDFCKINFGVTFPLMEKGPVKGEDKQEFYKLLLQASEKNSEVLWNFEKFLLNSKGEVIKRYNSKVNPEDIAPDLKNIL